MIISYKVVRHLPKFEYSQLPEASKSNARQAVLGEEIKAVQRDLSNVRTMAKNNINVLVNQQYNDSPRVYKNHIHGILGHKRHIQSLSDVVRLERYINGNLCHFLEDGTYVLYMM